MSANRKTNVSADGQGTISWYVGVAIKVVFVLVFVFSLYRLLQIVGGNKLPLSGTQLVVSVTGEDGRKLYTSSDLRKNTGADAESFTLEDGSLIEISSKRNARKKFIQVTAALMDGSGTSLWESEDERLQFTDDYSADIQLKLKDTGAETIVNATRVRYISDLRWLYLLLAAVGIGGFAATDKWAKKYCTDVGIGKFNKRVSLVGRYALLAVTLVIALFPILWMFFSSLMPSQRVMQTPPVIGITVESSLDNYIKVFSRAKYLRYYLNSVVTSSGTVIVVMFIALLASYSFSRYTFRGKNTVLTMILSVQMFPIVAILISLYGFYMRWNLVDNYFGVILADTVQALPLAIMLLRSFFDTLPRSLDESARIDGAGRFRVMFSILVPLTVPGLVAVGIYTFLNAWDDYLMALTIMKSDHMKTLTVGLAQSFLGEYAHDYGALMAFSMGGSLPIVLMFIFFQKYMISGLTAGAVKG